MLVHGAAGTVGTAALGLTNQGTITQSKMEAIDTGNRYSAAINQMLDRLYAQRQALTREGEKLLRMAAALKLFPFDFAIMLGDNMYGSQRPADFVTKFERPYKTDRKSVV